MSFSDAWHPCSAGSMSMPTCCNPRAPPSCRAPAWPATDPIPRLHGSLRYSIRRCWLHSQSCMPCRPLQADAISPYSFPSVSAPDASSGSRARIRSFRRGKTRCRNNCPNPSTTSKTCRLPCNWYRTGRAIPTSATSHDTSLPRPKGGCRRRTCPTRYNRPSPISSPRPRSWG